MSKSLNIREPDIFDEVEQLSKLFDSLRQRVNLESWQESNRHYARECQYWMPNISMDFASEMHSKIEGNYFFFLFYDLEFDDPAFFEGSTYVA